MRKHPPWPESFKEIPGKELPEKTKKFAELCCATRQKLLEDSFRGKITEESQALWLYLAIWSDCDVNAITKAQLGWATKLYVTNSLEDYKNYIALCAEYGFTPGWYMEEVDTTKLGIQRCDITTITVVYIPSEFSSEQFERDNRENPNYGMVPGIKKKLTFSAFDNHASPVIEEQMIAAKAFWEGYVQYDAKWYTIGTAKKFLGGVSTKMIRYLTKNAENECEVFNEERVRVEAAITGLPKNACIMTYPINILEYADYKYSSVEYICKNMAKVREERILPVAKNVVGTELKYLGLYKPVTQCVMGANVYILFVPFRR